MKACCSFFPLNPLPHHHTPVIEKELMNVIFFWFAHSLLSRDTCTCVCVKIYDSWKFAFFQVEGYIFTTCLTSVSNAIVFRVDNFMSWYKIAVRRLIELFLQGRWYRKEITKKTLKICKFSSRLKLLTNINYQLFCTENVRYIPVIGDLFL